MFRTGPAAMAVAAALVLSAASPAAAETETPSRLAGFYVGLLGGGAFFDARVKTGRKLRGQELRFDQRADGGIAGLRLGFGWRGASGLYLGVEAEGALGIDAEGRSAPFGIAFQGSYEGGASGFVRLGYAPADSLLLYLRAGGSYERYEMRINGGHRSASRGAPAFGVGIEAALSQNLSLRLDGTYVPPTGGLFEVEKYAATLGLSWSFRGPR